LHTVSDVFKKCLQCEEIRQSLESELQSTLKDFYPDQLTVQEG